MKFLFVCLGNICRSPVAEGIMLHLIEEHGLHNKFTVDSAGTAGYHIGEAPERSAPWPCVPTKSDEDRRTMVSNSRPYPSPTVKEAVAARAQFFKGVLHRPVRPSKI